MLDRFLWLVWLVNDHHQWTGQRSKTKIDTSAFSVAPTSPIIMTFSTPSPSCRPSRTSRSAFLRVLGLAALAVVPAYAQLANTIQYVGLSGVSAQQMFLGRPGKVYIVDKTGERPQILPGSC